MEQLEGHNQSVLDDFTRLQSLRTTEAERSLEEFQQGHKKMKAKMEEHVKALEAQVQYLQTRVDPEAVTTVDERKEFAKQKNDFEKQKKEYEKKIGELQGKVKDLQGASNAINARGMYLPLSPLLFRVNGINIMPAASASADLQKQVQELQGALDAANARGMGHSSFIIIAWLCVWVVNASSD